MLSPTKKRRTWSGGERPERIKADSDFRLSVYRRPSAHGERAMRPSRDRVHFNSVFKIKRTAVTTTGSVRTRKTSS